MWGAQGAYACPCKKIHLPTKTQILDIKTQILMSITSLLFPRIQQSIAANDSPLYKTTEIFFLKSTRNRI